MSPRKPAQGGLWGRPQPLITSTTASSGSGGGKARSEVNDLDLVASVVRSAQDPGYVLIGPAERVFLREPTRSKHHVVPVPRYEADTVSQLLDAGHLKIGGTHHVTDGRRDGPARSVLVPAATRSMVARWAALAPVNGRRSDRAGQVDAGGEVVRLEDERRRRR